MNIYPRIIRPPNRHIKVVVDPYTPPFTLEEYQSYCLSRPRNTWSNDERYLMRLIRYAIQNRRSNRTDCNLLLTSEEAKNIYAQAQDHHKEAIDQIIFDHNGRSIVALDMGLGKTFLAIFIAIYYAGRTLISSPPNETLDQFVREFDKWTQGKNKLRVIKSKKEYLKFASVEEYFAQSDYWIVSTELGKNMPEILEKGNWHTIIVDEAHELKGEDSIRARTWIKLLHQCKACLLLTGTPQDKGASDTFNLLHAIQPGIFPNREQFIRRYSVLIEKPEGMKFRNKKKRTYSMLDDYFEAGIRLEEELNLVLKLFMIRKLKENVASTQNLVFERECVRMDIPPHLIPDESEGPSKLWAKTGLAKVPYVWPYIRRELDKEIPPGETVLIFCQHVEVLEAYRGLCEKDGISCCYIHGDVDRKDRKEIYDAIRDPNNTKYRCAILTYSACYKGVHLVPGARRMFKVEPHRRAAVDKQTDARIYRIGQEQPAKSTTYVARGTYDEKLYKRLCEKHARNDRVVDGKRLKMTT